MPLSTLNLPSHRNMKTTATFLAIVHWGIMLAYHNLMRSKFSRTTMQTGNGMVIESLDDGLRQKPGMSRPMSKPGQRSVPLPSSARPGVFDPDKEATP